MSQFSSPFANIANIKRPCSEWNLASMAKLLVNYKIASS